MIENIPCQVSITYADALAQVSGQITGQLLIIGAIVAMGGLWNVFGGGSKEGKTYETITSALDMMMFMFGAYLVGLYAVVYWGWSPW